MAEAPENLTAENEDTYDSLMSLIENNQDRLALILVACDDLRLRKRVIERYESEARQAKIRPYRIVLGTEPSLRAGLAKLELRQGDAAVVTVIGAEWLLRVKMREEDEQSDLDKFFGYLQWTREGLREFRCPIVLWVTHRVLREMNFKAPDFWSWRKAVVRFESQEVEPILVRAVEERTQPVQSQPEDEFLPPLEELLSEIQQLESTSPDSANLATLYDKLGQVYAKRIESGKATNLDQERQQTINAFQNAIQRYQQLNHQSELVDVFISFGNFLDDQSRYAEAIDFHQKALEIAREIGNLDGEGGSLCNLGHAYHSLGHIQRAIEYYQKALVVQREVGNREFESNSLGGLGNASASLKQYQQAIDFHQQSLEIQREIGNRQGEATSLNNLGNAYNSLGQYERAINFYQQSLEIQREIGNRRGEALSLGNLGSAYYSLRQYERAINFYQQSLEIQREIGDRHNEAGSLFSKALALAKYESRRFEALTTLRQARAIYAELKLDYMVEKCDEEIYAFNQIIATEQPQSAPVIPSKSRSRAISKYKNNWVLWFCVGLAIVLLIAWLLK